MVGYNGYQRGVSYEKDSYTPEEIKSEKEYLIKGINLLIKDILEGTSIAGQPKTEKEKLEFLAQGILSHLEGDAVTYGVYTNGYILIPIPEGHTFDPKYTLPDSLYNYDIANGLCDTFKELNNIC